MHKKVLLVVSSQPEDPAFENKMLVDASGKPFICHAWEAGNAAMNVTDAIVATDNPEIVEVLGQHGVRAIQTATESLCGTDRIVELMEQGWDQYDAFVHLSPDEPEITAEMVDTCVDRLLYDHSSDLSTLATEFPDDGIDHLLQSRMKVRIRMRGDDGFAQGFYRTMPPYPCYRNMGIFAYTPQILKEWRTFPRTRAERFDLPQLGPFDANKLIGVDVVNAAPHNIHTKEDYNAWFLRAISTQPVSK